MSQIRLLNTRTGKFETFTDPQTVDYAILSHVWTKETSGRLAEQDHQDIIRLQQQSSDPNSSILVNERLSPKIRQACELAKADGYEWIWIDSCCIDKVSSTELSRSINSMYDWYRYASICYAHLADVDDGDAAATDAPDRPSEAQIVRFRQSAWFTRGWTLQELIAPSMVVFLSKNWRRIGTKHTLAAVIEDVTSVDRQVLRGQRPLSDICVAQRMAWAWNRRTTMEEDKAYCLVGIFGVQLAPMYGEGHNAFVRLQEEILKHIPDQTIFAWGDTMELRDLRSALRAGELPRAFPRQHLVPQSDSPPLSDSYLFASSPQKFLRASAGLALQSLSPDLGAGNAEYTITPYGIRATFPLMPVDPDHEDDSRTSEYFLALLGCRDQLKGRSVALLLRKLNNAFIPASSRSVGVKFDSVTAKETTYIRLVLLDEAEARIGQKALSSIIYVPYRATHTTQQIADDAHFETALHFSRTPIEITIPSWCRNLLERQGYKIIQDNRYHGDTSVTGYHAITLESRSQQSENVNLQLGHCSKCDEKALRATVSGDPLKANHARRSAASSDRGCAQEHLRSWHTYDRAVSKVFNVPTPFLADRCVQLTLRLKDRFGSVLGRYTLEIEILDLDHLGKKSSPQAKRSQSGMVIGAPYGMDRVGGRSRSADGTERKLVPDDPHFSVGGPYTTDNIPRPAPRYLTRSSTARYQDTLSKPIVQQHGPVEESAPTPGRAPNRLYTTPLPPASHPTILPEQDFGVTTKGYPRQQLQYQSPHSELFPNQPALSHEYIEGLVIPRRSSPVSAELDMDKPDSEPRSSKKHGAPAATVYRPIALHVQPAPLAVQTPPIEFTARGTELNVTANVVDEAMGGTARTNAERADPTSANVSDTTTAQLLKEVFSRIFGRKKKGNR